jgi:hypothetical protein
MKSAFVSRLLEAYQNLLQVESAKEARWTVIKITDYVCWCQEQGRDTNVHEVVEIATKPGYRLQSQAATELFGQAQ